MLSWWRLAFETSQMAFEAQQVVALRLDKLARGGAAAPVEVAFMISEKATAAAEALMSASLAGLRSGDPHRAATAFLLPYRRRIRANRRRLTR